jgi:MFS family permease
VLTLALMGTATVLIGCLPDYESIGLAAPILLTVLRLVQGLGIGGEWGGALLLAVEHSNRGNRGFFGSVPQMGVTVGMLLGTLALTAVSQLSEAQFLSWGWRIPFLLSAVLVFVGLGSARASRRPRRSRGEAKGQLAKVPIVETLRHHWRSVLLAVGLKVVETAPFYIFSAFVISYATTYAGYDKTAALNAVTVGALATTAAIPLMGRLADKVAANRSTSAGGVHPALRGAVFWMVSLKSALWLSVDTTVGLGSLAAHHRGGGRCTRVFSTRVRYTGVTLGYQLGAAIAGGTAPLVATALLKEFDDSWVPVAGYLMLTAAISLGCIAATRETRGTELAAGDGGGGGAGSGGPAPAAG